MNIEGLSIAVIGGGIGGMAAALALRQRGANVTVFEQAPELAEMGAGLQISANGMAVLRALGVAGVDPVAGLRSSGTEIRDYRAGRQVAELPGPAAGPTYYYHRADLLGVLSKAAIHAGVALRVGARVHHVDTCPSESEIVIEDGTRHRVQCVIAADGGRSVIRPLLNGPEAPAFTHQVAWRATIPWSRRNQLARAVLTMGPGRHVVTYPLRDHTLMNIAAFEERSDWQEEGWRQRGDPDELRQRFSDFGGLAGEVLGQVQDPHLWALFLRPVADRWQNGQVVLLGDAAHPTLPFMAQGACLALEDAWVLARAFDEQPNKGEALAAYETRRRLRAQKVVAAAAANARNFHLRGPLRLAAQAALMAAGPRLSRRYEWIYDEDVTA